MGRGRLVQFQQRIITQFGSFHSLQNCPLLSLILFSIFIQLIQSAVIAICFEKSTYTYSFAPTIITRKRTNMRGNWTQTPTLWLSRQLIWSDCKWIIFRTHTIFQHFNPIKCVCECSKTFFALSLSHWALASWMLERKWEIWETRNLKQLHIYMNFFNEHTWHLTSKRHSTFTKWRREMKRMDRKKKWKLWIRFGNRLI